MALEESFEGVAVAVLEDVDQFETFVEVGMRLQMRLLPDDLLNACFIKVIDRFNRPLHSVKTFIDNIEDLVKELIIFTLMLIIILIVSFLWLNVLWNFGPLLDV